MLEHCSKHTNISYSYNEYFFYTFWLFFPPVNLSGYLQIVARSLHTCSCNLVSIDADLHAPFTELGGLETTLSLLQLGVKRLSQYDGTGKKVTASVVVLFLAHKEDLYMIFYQEIIATFYT